MTNIRIFVNCGLSIDKEIKLEDKIFHYLANVMRVSINDSITFLNGIDGDFSANIISINKKYIIAKITGKIKNLQSRKFLGLIFTPIQKIDILLKGATELGATNFLPVITEYTNKSNLKLNKLEGNIIEAIEQCERNDFPKIEKIQKLEDVLNKINNDNNIIFFCEERTAVNNPINVFNDYKDKIKNKNIYALVGPEGGFSSKEKDLINSFKNTISINLGDTILRSETATISILSILKNFF